MRIAALIIGAVAFGSAASAAGIDSRLYTCDALQALVTTKRFVFISQATFGDFVVADASVCPDSGVLQSRSVATSGNRDCLVNYCVNRSHSSAN